MQISQWIRNRINHASFNVKYYGVPWTTLEIFEVFCFANYMIGTNSHFKYFSLNIIKIILQFWGGNKICILLLHHIALPGHISSLRNYFGTCKYHVHQFVQPKRMKSDSAVNFPAMLLLCKISISIWQIRRWRFVWGTWANAVVLSNYLNQSFNGGFSQLVVMESLPYRPIPHLN